jgi:hypothetical protein
LFKKQTHMKRKRIYANAYEKQTHTKKQRFGKTLAQVVRRLGNSVRVFCVLKKHDSFVFEIYISHLCVFVCGHRALFHSPMFVICLFCCPCKFALHKPQEQQMFSQC